MQNLLERTQTHFKKCYNVKLSAEQVRVAMKRLSIHFRWLAKWHSENEKQAATAALPVKEGEYKDAC